MNDSERTFSPCGGICEPEVCRPCPENSRDTVLPWLLVGGGRQSISPTEVHCVLTLDDEVARKNPALHDIREAVIAFPDATAPSREVLETCATVIDQAYSSGQRILVRCHGGLNRAPMVSAYWLITRQAWSPQNAIERLRELRARHAEYPLSNESFIGLLESL